MTEQKNVSANLKVLEAYTRDVGRGVARIDYDSMDLLGVSTGDVLQIKGGRISVAKCLPLYPSDEGKGMIRIDGMVRKNLEVQIGSTVDVFKVKAYGANVVTVSPLEAIPPIDERYLTDALESVPLLKADQIMVPYFGGRLTFQVIDVDPTDVPVIVSNKTLFKIIDDKETFEKYSNFGKAFSGEEERLLKELQESIFQPYTEDLGDKILSLKEKLEKLHKVKKITLSILKDCPEETPKSSDESKENKI